MTVIHQLWEDRSINLFLDDLRCYPLIRPFPGVLVGRENPPPRVVLSFTSSLFHAVAVALSAVCGWWNLIHWWILSRSKFVITLAIRQIARWAAVSLAVVYAVCPRNTVVSLTWLQCNKDETGYSNFTLNRWYRLWLWRIRGCFFGVDALYKMTFYLLTYFTYYRATTVSQRIL